MALGGLAVVGDDGISGLAVSPGVVVSEGPMRGVAGAGLEVRAHAMTGLAAALIRTRTDRLTGVGMSGWNRVRGRATGLVIGLYNDVDALDGVEIGLLNRARNNPAPFEFVPFINVHLP